MLRKFVTLQGPRPSPRPSSRLAVWALAATIIFSQACASSSDGRSAETGALEGRLVLTGSSTVAPLVSEIARRFEQEHPGVRIDVQTGGSSRGVTDARERLADIGMVSRALKEGERDLTAHTIARDGICLIVHRDNRIRELSNEQIVAIFTGKIANWSEVGGADAPITVVTKAEGRSTLELFLDHFRLKNSEIRAQVVIGDNEQGVKTVAGNPNAIGYVSIGTAQHDASVGTPIALLSMGGVAPTVENVANGTFPLARPLNLASSGPPEGLAKVFIDYARSKAVHDIVTGLYFVPVGD